MLEALHQYCFHAQQLPIRQNNDEQTPPGIVRHAYTFGTEYERTIFVPLENLERNRFTIVPTLPHFNLRGDAFGMASIPHDTLKFV